MQVMDVESSTAGSITYTGIDGLTIGAGMGEDNGDGAATSVLMFLHLTQHMQWMRSLLVGQAY